MINLGKNAVTAAGIEALCASAHLYYVRRPEIMTLAELAKVLDVLVNWSD